MARELFPEITLPTGETIVNVCLSRHFFFLLSDGTIFKKILEGVSLRRESELSMVVRPELMTEQEVREAGYEYIPTKKYYIQRKRIGLNLQMAIESQQRRKACTFVVLEAYHIRACVAQGISTAKLIVPVLCDQQAQTYYSDRFLIGPGISNQTLCTNFRQIKHEKPIGG